MPRRADAIRDPTPMVIEGAKTALLIRKTPNENAFDRISDSWQRILATPTAENVKMSLMTIQLATADYDKWRKTFEMYNQERRDGGFGKIQIYRDADNGNNVLLWCEVTDAAKVREFATSPDVAAKQRAGGVIGPPVIHTIG